MQNLDTLRTRACCAPLPREINNYYNRSHGKRKDKSDCKGSCYCESPNCSCHNKGLTGQLAKTTNTCTCVYCVTDNDNLMLIPNKTNCPKCKKPKRQRSVSPNSTRQKNIYRCCSPHRQPNVKQKCQKQTPQNVMISKPPTEKKYTVCYKSYEEGDSMLELPIQNGVKHEDILFHYDDDDCYQSLDIERNDTKDVNVKKQKNVVCTCGLMRPCDCKVGGLWSKGRGAKDAAPFCRRCGQKVYAAEKLVASGGAFHTSCFSCYGCHRALEVANLYESQGEIYCKQCYAKYFGMSGYGYGTTLLSPV